MRLSDEISMSSKVKNNRSMRGVLVFGKTRLSSWRQIVVFAETTDKLSATFEIKFDIHR